MTRRISVFLLLAAGLGGLILGLPAQDKDLTLMNAYSTLSPRIERAKTALRKDRLDKCESEALSCLRQLPEHQDAHFLLSQVLYKRGDFGTALDHICAAEVGYVRMARAISALDQRKRKSQSEALETLNKEVADLAAADAAVRGRGSCTPDRYTGALLESKNELAREEEEATRADGNRDLREVPAAYRYLHGNILFRLKRTAEAEAEYRQAIAKDPDFTETYNNLINLLYSGGRLEEARTVLAQAEAHKAKVHPELKKAVRGDGRG